MQMEDRIKGIITENLNPAHMQLENESYKHAGHAGDDGSGQTHFQLLVVSNIFQDCNRVERQRQVLAILKPCFDQGLHALSLKLFTPDEYSSK